MNADVTPMNADKVRYGMGFGKFGHRHPIPGIRALHSVIGVHRRASIGVHRRSKELRPHHSPPLA